jgi:hypothetical protein
MVLHMVEKVLIGLGLVGLSLLPFIGTSALGQRPVRDVPSRELVKRLYDDDLAQEAQYEIRERMIEIAGKGIDEDRELVRALLETLDSENIKVKAEAIANLILVNDQNVRKKLLQLLGPEGDGRVGVIVLAGIRSARGEWPVDDRDIENIKSIILRPTQSIDGDSLVKGTAILALGALGAVAALEDLQKHEWIRQNFDADLDAALTRARDLKKNTPNP